MIFPGCSSFAAASWSNEILGELRPPNLPESCLPASPERKVSFLSFFASRAGKKRQEKISCPIAMAAWPDPCVGPDQDAQRDTLGKYSR